MDLLTVIVGIAAVLVGAYVLYLLIPWVVIYCIFRILRLSGHPTTLAELDAAYVTPPEGENAVDDLLAAHAIIKKADNAWLGIEEDEEEDTYPEPPDSDDPDFEAKWKEWERLTDERHKKWEEEHEQFEAWMKAEEELEKKYGSLWEAPQEEREAVEALTPRNEEHEARQLREDALKFAVYEFDLAPGPLTERQRTDVHAYIEARKEAFDHLYRAADKTGCRSKMDFTQWPTSCTTDHLEAQRDGIKLLGRRAILRASNGDHDGAMEDVLLALRLVNILIVEPTMMAQWSRSACIRQVISDIEQVLHRCTLSPEQLHAIAEQTDRLEDRNAIPRALVGELCLTRGGFRLKKLKPDDAAAFESGPPPEALDTTAKRLRYRLLGFEALDCLYYLTRIRRLVRTSRLPRQEQYAAIHQDNDSTPTKVPAFAPQANESLFWFDTITDAGIATSAAILMAQVGLAVARYAAGRGALPDQLDDLVPDYFDAVPADPYCGQPCRFTSLPSHFTIDLDPTVYDQLNSDDFHLQSVAFRGRV